MSPHAWYFLVGVAVGIPVGILVSALVANYYVKESIGKFFGWR